MPEAPKERDMVSCLLTCHVSEKDTLQIVSELMRSSAFFFLIKLLHLHLSLPSTPSLSYFTFIIPSLLLHSFNPLYSPSHPSIHQSILLFLISYTCLCLCLCLCLPLYHHPFLSLTTPHSISLSLSLTTPSSPFLPLQVPTDAQLTIVEPEDQHLKTVIDMTAQFISADGEVFEKVQNTLPLALLPMHNSSSSHLFTFPFSYSHLLPCTFILLLVLFFLSHLPLSPAFSSYLLTLSPT